MKGVRSIPCQWIVIPLSVVLRLHPSRGKSSSSGHLSVNIFILQSHKKGLEQQFSLSHNSLRKVTKITKIFTKFLRKWEKIGTPIKQGPTLTFWSLEKELFLSFISYSTLFNQPCKNNPGQSGQDSKQDSRYRTAETGQLGHGIWGQQDGQNMTPRLRQWGHKNWGH